jgi:hypothetical protein
MHRWIALLLVALLATPAVAFAQSAERAPEQTIDVSRLGVDVSRIQRELAQAEETESSDSPLKLRFTVQVIGVAPKIDLLEGFPVQGAIPYGAPTHQEILQVLTPQAYRSPTADFLGLAVFAAQKLWQYNKKRQCEAEIAEYRRLVMQGVNIAAPRCSQ